MRIPINKDFWGHEYRCLRQAVKEGAATAEKAAKLFGVTPRHFRRLVSKGKGPMPVEFGRSRLYPWDQVEYYAKLHRVGRILKSLKEKNLNDSQRKLLLNRLERKKLEYFLETSAAPGYTIDALLIKLDRDPQFRCNVQVWLQREFGSDNGDIQGTEDLERGQEDTSISRGLPPEGETLH